MEIHNPQNKEYYCPTCGEGFDNSDQYKMHYKSDYHRYNIKRKMVKLPPITFEQYSTKAHQSKNEVVKQYKCNQCKKVFGSANTFNQHVSSKGHNPNIIIQEKQKIVRVAPSFVKNSKKCLFCQNISRDFSQNQIHMQNIHSFFISQKEFCIDMQGLIEYLQEKIEVGHMCITCQNKKAKDFQSGEAVRKHMMDKGHSIMKVDEGFEEYQKYYDFSRLFEQKIAEQTRIVPGISFQTVKVYDNSDSNRLKQNQDQQDQEQWQSQDDEQEQIQQMNEQKEVKKPKIKIYQIMKPTLTPNDELLLPNGKLLGHRKYRHIYRQTLRLPNQFALQLKCLTEGNDAASNALIDRRALLQLIKKQTASKGDMFRSKKHALKVGMVNNKLQHYFRCATP